MISALATREAMKYCLVLEKGVLKPTADTVAWSQIRKLVCFIWVYCG
jgi:hypothetical protein